MTIDINDNLSLLRSVLELESRKSDRQGTAGQPDGVFAEQLDWMLRPDGSISTAEVIGWTVFVTPPADALGMLGMDREVRHSL